MEWVQVVHTGTFLGAVLPDALDYFTGIGDWASYVLKRPHIVDSSVMLVAAVQKLIKSAAETRR
ncbi:hypothetical protein [Streptomyces sp. NPDC059651]|uniref:hypothetical protein n=1 Tax=Streptomyces sp. NPDC059651 TaxID=3346897 RepID=UPI003693799E